MEAGHAVHGGLKSKLPITFWTFLVGTIAIAGIPPLAGFFSKDEILWKTFSSGHPVLWGLAVFAAFLTATYMFRLLYMTFYGTRRPGSSGASHGHDDLRSPGASAPGTHAEAEAPALHGGAHLHDAPPAMGHRAGVLGGLAGRRRLVWRDARAGSRCMKRFWSPLSCMTPRAVSGSS